MWSNLTNGLSHIHIHDVWIFSTWEVSQNAWDVTISFVCFFQTNFNFFFEFDSESIFRQWIHFPSTYSGGSLGWRIWVFFFSVHKWWSFLLQRLLHKITWCDLWYTFEGYRLYIVIFETQKMLASIRGFTDWYWQILSHAHATWEDVLGRLKAQKVSQILGRHCVDVFLSHKHHQVPSLKLTYPLKMDGWKMNFLLKSSLLIFWCVKSLTRHLA